LAEANAENHWRHHMHYRASQRPANDADAYALSIIDAPGSSLTVACDIDTVGRTTGYYADNSGTHGFLIDNGAFVTIDFPGAGGPPHTA
jgi:hypothetical protein